MKLFRFILIIAYMGTITYLSGGVGPQIGISFVGIDKLGHFIVFGLLGIQFVRLRPVAKSRSCRLNRLIFGVGCTLIFGLSDELHQATNPLRQFEWADLVADGMGAFCFIWLWLWVPQLEKWGDISIPVLAGKLRKAKTNK